MSYRSEHSTAFPPSLPPTLSASEIAYLYIYPSDDLWKHTSVEALRPLRQEQALLRSASQRAVELLSTYSEADLEFPLLSEHLQGDSRSIVATKHRTQTSQRILREETEDVQSPFGDVITSLQEVLAARYNGRAALTAKHPDTPQPTSVELHPAISFKFYTPHQRRSSTSRTTTRRQYHRKQPTYTAVQDISRETIPHEVRAFHHRLEHVLYHEAELPHTATIIVAVSGGVDSIALLDMLICIAEHRELSIIAAHFNHGLRGQESDHDAAFVRETCRRYGIPCYIAYADVKRFAEVQNMSLEQAGRELRYRFLEFTAYKHQANAVCTAHTLNDSVETVLMNMLRGSGLAGLAGISTQRAFGKHTTLLRPCVGMQKAELHHYALVRGLSWREDSSNTDITFRRNKIRHHLLPLLEREYSPNIVTILHRTSQILAGADEIIRDTVERILPSLLVQEDTQPYIGFNVSILRTCKRFLQSECIRRAVQRRFGLMLGFDAIEKVLRLVDTDVGTKCDITRGFIAVRDRSMILLGYVPAVHQLNVKVEKNNYYDFGGWRIFLEEVDRKNVKFTADPAIEFIDTRSVPYRMTLRTWQPGDVFTPFGMKGTMKVSDYLTNSKIPFFHRQHVLVLTARTDEGERIVWLCGLRLSEHFRLSNDAPTALRLEFRRPKGILFTPPPHDML
ncbi:MAG: tRNA lysidine(34) synthetase TilS [Bacteroidota bacterium]|nr:tRNA lysidine(34) synthetase TilS [Candidatus Kapabacteria bacterium]MDW8219671.1 tRNA lysidine(34) synthetase TilS [Bacteroidota bacterium]